MKLALVLALAFAALPGLILMAQDAPTKDTPREKGDPKGARDDAPKPPKEETELPEDSLYRLSTKTLEGKDASLKDYSGKVTLIVNVASKCGYTPQYKGLEKLHQDFKEKGFFVLGFPSNDFGKQEPGTADEIKEFCSIKYSVTFPLFEKCVTKAGDDQSAIYANLKKQSNELPNWNFCKYLVGKDGKVIKFYKSATTPEDESLRKDIEAALAKK